MTFPDEHIDIYKKMANNLSCGGCGITISKDSEYSCEKCGRMLCHYCGIRWGVCKDHRPICSHPEWIPTRWNQDKPEPSIVVGRSKFNYACPICGFGIGSYPDPTDELVKNE